MDTRSITVSQAALIRYGGMPYGWRVVSVDPMRETVEIAPFSDDAVGFGPLAFVLSLPGAGPRAPQRIDREQDRDYAPEWAEPLDKPRTW